MNPETKKQLVQQAVDKIKTATGMTITLVSSKKAQPDGYYLDIIQGCNSTRITITVYANLTKNMVTDIAARLQSAAEKPVLITNYIAAPLADYLKNLNIPFIDTVGNAYIKTPPLFIFIKGNKLRVKSPATRPSRVFGTAGLKIIYALLCNPALVSMTYRHIAQKADCALGSVNAVFKDLQHLNYLLDNKIQGRLLVNREELLRRWLNAYAEQLRPKIFIERYASKNHDWWQDVDLLKYNALWGGEVAAARLSNGYLKPQDLTIYAAELPREMIVQYRLFPEPGGNIEIIKSFWGQNDEFFRQGSLVPPILVYADLIASGDQRNIEVAGMIYEQHIARFVGQD